MRGLAGWTPRAAVDAVPAAWSPAVPPPIAVVVFFGAGARGRSTDAARDGRPADAPSSVATTADWSADVEFLTRRIKADTGCGGCVVVVSPVPLVGLSDAADSEGGAAAVRVARAATASGCVAANAWALFQRTPNAAVVSRGGGPGFADWLTAGPLAEAGAAPAHLEPAWPPASHSLTRAPRRPAGPPSVAAGTFAPATHARQAALVPAATALLVIDAQNYVCSPEGGLYSSSDGATIDGAYFFGRLEGGVLAAWARLVAAARACAVEVIYTVMASLTPDGRDRGLDYKLSGFHVPPHSWDAAVVGAAAPLRGEIVLPKTSSSPFQSTNLNYLLRAAGHTQLVVCGCVTDQCVDGAVRDACDLGYLGERMGRI